jgi:hypothetical protein
VDCNAAVLTDLFAPPMSYGCPTTSHPNRMAHVASPHLCDCGAIYHSAQKNV